MSGCMKCATVLEPNVKFCPECGTGVVTTAARPNSNIDEDVERLWNKVTNAADGAAKSPPYAAPNSAPAPGINPAVKKRGISPLVGGAYAGTVIAILCGVLWCILGTTKFLLLLIFISPLALAPLALTVIIAIVVHMIATQVAPYQRGLTPKQKQEARAKALGAKIGIVGSLLLRGRRK